MATAAGLAPEVRDGDVSSPREAEELFDTLATDGKLASEADTALVSAVAFLGLTRSKAQVAVAIREVGPLRLRRKRRTI